MATQSHRQFMPYEVFEALPRYGKITELLDGEYVVVSPTLRHQILSGELFHRFRLFLGDNPIGRAVFAPFDVVLSKPLARVVQPDVLFMSHQTLERAKDARLEGVPDLAVEVLSGDGKHDKGKKLAFYDEYGIPELWHVSQTLPRIEVYRRDAAGKLVKVLNLKSGDVVESPLLPGFRLAVDDLYRDLEL